MIVTVFGGFVELKVKIFLIIILIALVAVAVFFLTQKKPDEFEIFSNLPTENASVIMQVNLNEKSFAEVSKIIGSILGGGIKEIKGAQMGIVLSNDTTGIIIYVGTNKTVSEVLQEARVPSSGLTNRTIGGKVVTVIEIGSGINSVCLWKDGDWLKILTTQQGVLPYLSASGTSSLYSIKPKEAEQCYDIMQKSYDTAYVRDFFKETEEFKQRITVNGEYLGEIRAVSKNVNMSLLASLPGMEEKVKEAFNKPISASGYSVFSGDDNVDYSISISHSGGLMGNDKLPCYNLSILFVKQESEIVKQNGKEACLSKSEISYGTLSIEILSAARSVGNYSISASAYVKGDSSKVRDYLEGVVFSQSFEGNERGWTDKMSPKVKVLEGSKYEILLNTSAEKKPLEGVKVSLYALNESYLTMPTSFTASMKGSFIETVMTNSLGEADFEELPDAIYYVEANKSGYTSDYGTVSPGTSYTELYIQPKLPVEVKVTDYSSSLPLGGAKVDLYKGSVLISTSYTDSDGIASFGNITVDSGEVIVNKTGYDVRTSYIFQGAAMPIEVGLFKSYVQPSPPLAGGSSMNITGSPSEGSDSAKVIMVEFSDFQCPYCGMFVTNTLPQIKSNYIDTGKVKLVYKYFPLPFHQNAEKAAEAAACAGDQGKFWEMHDILYQNQGVLAVSNLKTYASNLGMNTTKFNQCLDNGMKAQVVQNDIDYGTLLGVTGTPTFYINGKEFVGAQPYSTFKQEIDAAAS